MRPLTLSLPSRSLLARRTLFTTTPRRQEQDEKPPSQTTTETTTITQNDQPHPPTPFRKPPIARPTPARIPPSLASLSLGTDICHIPRIQKLLDERGLRFASRILTEEEVSAAMGRGYLLRGGTPRGPALAGGSGPFVAGRLAAKEAVKKAFPGRKLGWHDVVIENRRTGAERSWSGPPVAVVRTEEDGWEEALVSISHDGDYATAVCLGSRTPSGGRPKGNAGAAAGGRRREGGSPPVGTEEMTEEEREWSRTRGMKPLLAPLSSEGGFRWRNIDLGKDKEE